jgi:hypothetical protein
MSSNESNIATLSRSELQKLLKQNGMKATGTTECLRERATVLFQSIPSTMASARRVIDLTGGGNGAAASPAKKQKQNPPSSRPPKQPKAKKPVKETRLKRFRTTCSQPTRQRIERARTQRMFLVKMGNDNISPSTSSCDFVVLGSTGNVYTVTIGPVGNCTCPDHQKGNLCKHILFVLLKVFRLDPSSNLIYQAAWVPSELEAMFSHLTRRLGDVSGSSSSGILANAHVRATYAKMEAGHGNDEDDLEAAPAPGVKRQPIQEDSDCSICFDPLGKQNITFCRVQCGANFHKTCLEQWLRVQGNKASCPMCRQAWDTSSSSSNTPTTKEGYTNLGRMQGQSPVRDTSTYYSPSYYGKRSGYYGRW